MHYTIGKWSGLPNYSCTHCPFSTLDEAEILTHIIERHLPQPEEQAAKSEPEETQDLSPTQGLPVLLVTQDQLDRVIQDAQETAPKPSGKRSRKEK
jgi:hypothetical protein